MKRLLSVLALLVPLPAAAHVHVHPEQAAPGQTVEIALQIGHGCAGAATTGLRVAVPAGLTGIAVAPPSGWTAATVTDAATGRVTEILWSGGELPDKIKATFAFTATVGQASGALALPVIQICGGTELRWIETGAGAEHPAPVLTVAPGA